MDGVHSWMNQTNQTIFKKQGLIIWMDGWMSSHMINDWTTHMNDPIWLTPPISLDLLFVWDGKMGRIGDSWAFTEINGGNSWESISYDEFIFLFMGWKIAIDLINRCRDNNLSSFFRGDLRPETATELEWPGRQWGTRTTVALHIVSWNLKTFVRPGMLDPRCF